MEPVADLNELTERIRRAADRENGAHALTPNASGSVVGELPLPGALPALIVSALTADILDQAKQMLPGARRKNEVAKTVPKLLRPLYRNQGGFNGVMLEIIERLVTANRQLAEQIGQFRDWADAVGQASAQTQAWAAATDVRLEALRDERLVEMEVRLNRLEQLPAPTEKRSTDSPSEVGSAELRARIERLEAQLARLDPPTMVA